MKKFIILSLATVFVLNLFGQGGTIKGTVVNEISNEIVPFASVYVTTAEKGATTDENGKFEIVDIEPGLHNLRVSSIGFQKKTVFEISVTRAKPAILEIKLASSSTQLGEVVVESKVFVENRESPVSMRTLQAAEIERFPGGNRDVSKVLQSLPGVAANVTFRNDIIIRGGSPGENRFFLDGIEVPVINHFATQGASGGPNGILNVNLLREVDFLSAAFPANRGNALSSVLQFKQKDGNPEKLQSTFLLGSSDAGITLDGPLGKRTSFVFSARRSYLQYLFSVLKLPFLPTYTDAQFKVKFKADPKNEFTFIGLGGYDQFRLNKEVNDGVTDSAVLERNNYILGNLPVNNQWNYTIGTTWKHFLKKGYFMVVASRSHLYNEAFKYKDNDESSENNLLFKYDSEEAENKFRFEYITNWKGYRLNAGVGFHNALFTQESTVKRFDGTSLKTFVTNSKLPFNKYALFGQISKSYLDDKLSCSFGLRTDVSDYATSMLNPVDQLSPRFSISYQLLPRLSVNGSVGRYTQLPPFTTMGFSDQSGKFVNQEQGLKYMVANHYVMGIAFKTENSLKISIEGFHKQYGNYPFLLRDSISLANLGAGFGVIGIGEAQSISEGRSYGVEFLAQQKLWKGLYAILAYTYVHSQFKDKNDEYVPSSWDSRNIVSLTGGKKFKRNWELGVRWVYSGGSPYTPYDIELSSQKQYWDIEGEAVPDYDRINSGRLKPFHQLDLRVDKRFFFKNWSLSLYLDIQNVYNFQNEQAPYLNVVRDKNGTPLTDPNDASRYLVKEVKNSSGRLLPALGMLIEF